MTPNVIMAATSSELLVKLFEYLICLSFYLLQLVFLTSVSLVHVF